MSRVKDIDEIRTEFPEDASVLVTGTCTETIGSLHQELLWSAVDDDEAAVVVTTEDTAEGIRRRFDRSAAFTSTAGLAVVDGTPKDRRHAEPERNVWKTSSPVDFGGAMLALRRGYESLAVEYDTIHLLFDTLTTPLLATDSSTLMRFAHQVMLEGGSKTGLQLFPVCTNVTSNSDVTKLKHLSEGMIEVRKRGGTRQVRLRGPPETPNEWLDLSEQGHEFDVRGFV
ncbi:DUF7504 family protein [Natranaeroarchaeum sulfidigenes]|uniref:KaiC-like protein ATPase n=1 Tax=Natranaeroarchaeum sulfidigenes TaxID=2784880 RepID=A0A897MLT7_9EURY|nr:hypothetical protein [Natranaeroarchaeum sulfidigenes]QSG01577.1 KaiC-like protein ATPase [Natranaeroarchaeum sulfidigenes]